MNNFRQRYYAFMQGRNGTDALYIGMLAVYAALIVLNLFLRSRTLYIIIWAWFILATARVFSKNIVQRQKENAAFVRLLDRLRTKKFKKDPLEIKAKPPGKLKKKRQKYQTMFRDRKTHVFRKCPQCAATIRLPKVKGEHTVCCPKCNTDFKVKIRG